MMTKTLKNQTSLDRNVKILPDKRNLLRVTDEDAIAYKAPNCFFLTMIELTDPEPIASGFQSSCEQAAWDAASEEAWESID